MCCADLVTHGMYDHENGCIQGEGVPLIETEPRLLFYAPAWSYEKCFTYKVVNTTSVCRSIRSIIGLIVNKVKLILCNEYAPFYVFFSLTCTGTFSEHLPNSRISKVSVQNLASPAKDVQVPARSTDDLMCGCMPHCLTSLQCEKGINRGGHLKNHKSIRSRQ